MSVTGTEYDSAFVLIAIASSVSSQHDKVISSRITNSEDYSSNVDKVPDQRPPQHRNAILLGKKCSDPDGGDNRHSSTILAVTSVTRVIFPSSSDEDTRATGPITGDPV